MNESRRRISVIVPTCNRPTMLCEALISIRSLEGSLYSFEIIISDNGNSPEVRRISREFGALYVAVDRIGASATRNAALRLISGDYVAFLDDDDVWLPAHLHQHLDILDACSEIEAVLSQVIYTDQNLKPTSLPFPEFDPGAGDALLKSLLGKYLPQIGTLVARASLIKEIGEFDEKLISGQDMDWIIRIARRRTLRWTPVPSVLFRSRKYLTYDALHASRVRFGRKVFLRHAIPEWRLWDSMGDFLGAYRARLQHFYQYFVDAAVNRAEHGDKIGAVFAILHAFKVFPARAAFHTLAKRPLRNAVIAILRVQQRIG